MALGFHAHPVFDVQLRKLGGPNTDFLNQYGLDKKHHPDWFTAFMPLTPMTTRRIRPLRTSRVIAVPSLERGDRVRSCRPQRVLATKEVAPQYRPKGKCQEDMSEG